MQNKEGLVCGACAEALLCLRFFFSVDGVPVGSRTRTVRV
jgi:hypothetical protein